MGCRRGIWRPCRVDCWRSTTTSTRLTLLSVATTSVARPPLLMSRGLLAEARHLVLPDGITSSGFPAVEATCRQLGIGYDPWQAEAARCILGKSATGWYAADTVVMSIPRQVGKTFLLGGLVFADCIINPGTTT